MPLLAARFRFVLVPAAVAAAAAWFLAFAVAPVLAAEAKSVNYEDDVKPILRQNCFKCHGDDQQKGDLNLQNYKGLLKGGSGGEIVKGGRPSGSVLYQAIAHEGDATPMPPNSPRLPDAQVAIVREWIESGLRETASSEAAGPQRRSLEYTPTAVNEPAGAPPMPEDLPPLATPAAGRPHPVTALATSPRAPLAAVAGHQRIILYNTQTREPIGGLDFPEGIPYVLRFSRDGRVLLAAGGRPVQAGKAVLYDVKSGRRLALIGDELDSVLSCDLSADQQQLALGGSGKVVKVYNTRDGQLLYKITKHTDWITAIAYNPDGSRLATADRNGGVHVWDAKNGGILLSLAEHKDSVAALDWRSDGQVLATGGEDGKLILWDVADGWPVATLPSPHAPKQPPGHYGKLPGGVLSLAFSSDGRLATIGRDRWTRLWNGLDKQVAAFETAAALPTKIGVSQDGQTLVVGDSLGQVHFHDASGTASGKRG